MRAKRFKILVAFSEAIQLLLIPRLVEDDDERLS